MALIRALSGSSGGGGNAVYGEALLSSESPITIDTGLGNNLKSFVIWGKRLNLSRDRYSFVGWDADYPTKYDTIWFNSSNYYGEADANIDPSATAKLYIAITSVSNGVVTVITNNTGQACKWYAEK